jgi:hypothetical protein
MVVTGHVLIHAIAVLTEKHSNSKQLDSLLQTYESETYFIWQNRPISIQQARKELCILGLNLQEKSCENVSNQYHTLQLAIHRALTTKADFEGIGAVL